MGGLRFWVFRSDASNNRWMPDAHGRLAQNVASHTMTASLSGMVSLTAARM